VPIGLRELDLEPRISWTSRRDNPHFLVLGDSVRKDQLPARLDGGLAGRTTAWQTRFVLADYRRGLFDAVGEEYLGAIATEQDSVAAYLAQVAAKLKQRIRHSGLPHSSCANGAGGPARIST